ncbi:hypothetical protein VP1G_11214 [Cytospora mali]|uniref:Stress-response A/B barrel domain-containing protein n=1 Tax=Cytospora mali TaxID=578113 RepID=A0A194V8M6_CYTMA|nr:hypothetical protein VP1G_11214 [Valsa mali var. pyri (nom. inval.)]
MAIFHLVLVRAKHDADQEALRKSRFGQDGLTHAFILEFEKDEDREYYLKKEPYHKEFVANLKGLIDKITIIDFSSGVF